MDEIDFDQLTYARLKRLLTYNFGCQYVGSVAAPPYCSEIDMPDAYKAPNGQHFNVSQPDGLYHHAFVLPELIKKFKLVLMQALEDEEDTVRASSPV